MKEKNPIVVIGFGSQAKAWLLNLKDSKYPAYCALRESSPSINESNKLNISTITLGEDLLDYQLFAMLTPDQTHHKILEEYKKYIKDNSIIIYAHGYSNIDKNLKTQFPQYKHILLAPKTIASQLRFSYETNQKLGACYSCDEKSITIIEEIAKAIGITSLYPVSFQEETTSDLFAEQSLLCSVIPYGALLCYKFLRASGISAEAAYLDCWFETRLIVETLIKKGPEKFFNLISPNALIGSEKAKDILFDKDYQEKLKNLLEDINSKSFFKEVENAKIDKIKDKINKFWKNEELTKVHNKMSEDLY